MGRKRDQGGERMMWKLSFYGIGCMDVTQDNVNEEEGLQAQILPTL